MKVLAATFMIALLFSALAGTLQFGAVQAATNIAGIINSDTTWTKANSPYTLAGPVAVNRGVTLTIEPGVTVNLGKYYLQVNGTLRAQGTSENKIVFNSEPADQQIVFNDESIDWNEETGSGSIIENAVLTFNLIFINYTSPRISSNSINSGRVYLSGSSSVISNNTITGTIFTGHSSVAIANNTFYNDYIAINTIEDRSTISNNIIIGGETGIISRGDDISKKNFVSKNTVYDCDVGINTAYSTIEQNLIVNNNQGIVNGGHSVIQNNTIANNAVGIYSFKPSTILYNNIRDNSEYNILLNQLARDNLNATFNWWGTTNTQAISDKIYDNKRDFNLGTVTFEPFLTEPNPEAPAMPTSISTPTPPPTDAPSMPTPSQEPQQAELTTIVGAVIVAVVLGAGLGLLIYLIKRK